MHAPDEPVNERGSALAPLIERATAASRRCEILQVGWSSSRTPEYASDAIPVGRVSD